MLELLKHRTILKSPVFVIASAAIVVVAQGMTHAPLVGMFVFFVVPTAALVFVSIFVGWAIGSTIQQSALIAAAIFLAVGLAGICDRYSDRYRIQSLYSPTERIEESVRVFPGTHVRVVLHGPYTGKGAELVFNSVKSRLVYQKCHPKSCVVGIEGLEWFSITNFGRPTDSIEGLGLTLVSEEAPIEVKVLVEEEDDLLNVRTDVMKDQRIVATFNQRLPKVHPDYGRSLLLSHLLQNNLLALMFSPPVEYVESDPFGPFLRRVFDVSGTQ